MVLHPTEASKAEQLAPSGTSAATAARVQGVLSLADIAISKSRAVKSSLACATGTLAPLPSLTPEYATKLSKLSGAAAGAESGSAALGAIQSLAKINLSQSQKPAEIIPDDKDHITSKAARRAQMLEEFGDSDLFGTGITKGAAEKANAISPAPVTVESKAARRAQVVEEFGDSNIFGSRNIGVTTKDPSEKLFHCRSSDRKNVQKSATIAAATENNNGKKTSSLSKLRRHQSERKLVDDNAAKKEGDSISKPPRAKQLKRHSSERHVLKSSNAAAAAAGNVDGSAHDLSSSSSRLLSFKSDRNLARSSTANVVDDKSKELRRRESRRRLNESKKDGKSFHRTKSLEESPITAAATYESPLNSSSKDRRSRRRSDTATKRSSGVRSCRQSGRHGGAARNVGTCQVQQAITAEAHKDDVDEDEKEEEEEVTKEILNSSNDTLSTQQDSSGSLLLEEGAPDPMPATGSTARKSFFGSIQLPSLSAMTSQQELGGSQSNDTSNNDSAGGGTRSSFFKNFSSTTTATNTNPLVSVTSAAKNMTTAFFGGQYKDMDGDTENLFKDNQDNNPAICQEGEDPAAIKEEENDNSGSFSHTEDDEGAATVPSPRRSSGSCPATLIKAQQRQRRGVSRRYLSNGKGASSRKLHSSRKLGAVEAEPKE